MGFWGNMRFSNQILSYLKAHGEFFPWVRSHLNESGKVENTLEQIVNTVLYGIGIQCIPNMNSEEIFKIAKELASTKIASTWFLPDMVMQIKGNGANSEIFGAKFGCIVNIISAESNLKPSSVYKLFAVLTPLILADIYYNYKSPHYSLERMDRLITKIIKGIRPSPPIRECLQSLQKKRTCLTVNDQRVVAELVV